MRISLLEAINEVLDVAKTKLDNIVDARYVVSEEDIDVNKAKNFPALFVMLTTPSNINDAFNVANITLYFLDASTSQNNEIEKDLNIKSDLFQQASILLDELQLIGSIGTVNNSLEPFSGRFNNGLSGWTTSISINLKKPCYNV